MIDHTMSLAYNVIVDLESIRDTSDSLVTICDSNCDKLNDNYLYDLLILLEDIESTLNDVKSSINKDLR